MRGVFRVPVAGALITVEANGVPQCHVIDASSEGLAIVPPPGTTFSVNQLVELKLSHEGREVRGRAWVRHVSTPEHSPERYGLTLVPAAEEFKEALRQIAMAVQREQLRERATRKH
jgi:hypothetical protein